MFYGLLWSKCNTLKLLYIDHTVIQIMRILMSFHGQNFIIISYFLFWSLFLVDIKFSFSLYLQKGIIAERSRAYVDSSDNGVATRPWTGARMSWLRFPEMKGYDMMQWLQCRRDRMPHIMP